MSLAWSSVKALSIPVGGTARDVKRVSVGGTVLWEKPNPLPYDAEVEYIESTGTQYIDTGVTQSSGYFAVDLTATVTSGTKRYDMFFGTANGSGDSLYDRLVAYNDSQQYIRFRVFRGMSFAETSIGYPTLTIGKTKYSLSAAKDVYIFFTPSYSDYKARCRLRLFKLWDSSGVLVRDYIPVRVGSGSSAVGYLYDRANPTGGPLGNGLYGNSGSGAFVVGPDKSS